MTVDTMFSARQVPWYKIGTIIDEPDVDSQEAARRGGLDFDVELRQLSWGNNAESDNPDDASDMIWSNIPTRRAIIRRDTDEFFGICSTDYQVVQYRDAFSFMDEINPRYVAAGTMSDGRQGFMVVQLPDCESHEFNILGENDPHDMYVVLRTSHDLSKAIEVALVNLRQRCMNQLTLPTLMANVPQHWSVKHVGDPIAKLKEAQLVLRRAPEYAQAIEQRANQLAAVQMRAEEFRPIMKRVLRPSMTKRDDMVQSIIELHKRDTVGFEGTGWGWVNTVSEYFQWGRSTGTRTDQSLFTDTLDGDGAKYIGKVMTAIMSRT